MFHRMPLILIGLILFVLLFGQYLPLGLMQVLFAGSLTIKSLILFLLPLVIFGLLFNAAVNLAKYALPMIALIITSVCVSNFIAAYFSHYIGSAVYQMNLTVSLPKASHALQAAWSWQFPQLIANDKAMLFAVCVGVIFNLLDQERARRVSVVLNRVVGNVLKFIVYLIPLFVTGYLVKLYADGLMLKVIKDYAGIFAVIAVTQFVYISFLYLLANGFKPKQWLANMQNMFPAVLSGFSSMSSAASMPLTIKGVEQNATNKTLATSIVPATVNIHLLGDCVAIPVFAYAVMKGFGVAEPSMLSYMIFTMYFVLAKFSVAAVPGGGIVVMLPILASYLGFDSAMLSLITALYILFDPVITAANIYGNGALAKIIDRVLECSMMSKMKYRLATK